MNEYVLLFLVIAHVHIFLIYIEFIADNKLKINYSA